MPADAAAVARALALAGRFATEAGLETSVATSLAIIVEECVANIVEHGEPQAGALIVLRLSFDGQTVRLAVSDAGRAFDPRSATFEEPNIERGGGVGLALIADLCRIASYARRRGRNHLVLELPLTPRG
jgi:anti-sigma regulatory factor (Ser/Thr protein kinase)